MIAKKIVDEVVNVEREDRFELFETVKATGVDNKEVDVLKSMGTYTVSNLDAQIASLTTQIDALNAKKKSITDLV